MCTALAWFAGADFTPITGNGGKGLITFFGILGAYFLPGIVAQCRGHHNANAITMLDLLLGWTVLGWIVALVWAMTDTRR